VTDHLKIVDFKSKKDKEEDEFREKFKKDICELLDGLKKAVEDDRLEQIVLQWEEALPEEEVKDGDPPWSTSIIHYNKNGDMDQSLGYAERLKQRLFLLTEGYVNE
jgi:hypothetical protein